MHFLAAVEVLFLVVGKCSVDHHFILVDVRI